MIKIKDVSTQKKRFNEFKKIIDNSYRISVHIKPNMEEIILSAFNKFDELSTMTIPIESQCSYKSIRFYADTLECAWDILFNKDGFCYTAYKDNYNLSNVDITLSTGTKAYISMIELYSRNKKWKYTELCSQYSDCVLD